MAKWYLYEDEEVLGPFTPDQLTGRIDDDTLVCRAGSEDWQKARTIDDLKPILQPQANQPSSATSQPSRQSGDSKQRNAETTRETSKDSRHESTRQKPDRTGENDSGAPTLEAIGPEDLIEPTLENLRDICERSENNALIREYEEYWEDYDAEERRIILEEIQNRGLFEQI